MLRQQRHIHAVRSIERRRHCCQHALSFERHNPSPSVIRPGGATSARAFEIDPARPSHHPMTDRTVADMLVRNQWGVKEEFLRCVSDMPRADLAARSPASRSCPSSAGARSRYACRADRPLFPRCAHEWPRSVRGVHPSSEPPPRASGPHVRGGSGGCADC
jgi:hypothetical protein